MSEKTKLEQFGELLKKKQLLEAQNPALEFFPPNGPYSIDKYPKHKEFCELTKEYDTVAIISGNRVGKTTLEKLIIAQWLTGEYYDWYNGHKYNRAIQAMCFCDTNQNLRDVWSRELLGSKQANGSYAGGYIPSDKILNVVVRAGAGGLIDYATIKNPYGKPSVLYFKSYQQERESLNGYTLDVLCIDEEPPMDLYSEACTRLLTAASKTKDAKTLISYTPLRGMGELVTTIENEFRLPASKKSMGTVRVSMYEVPHIAHEEIEKHKKKWPRIQWDARIYGKPNAGAGMFYPIPDDDIIVKPFKVPEDWPRFMGFDYGFNRTAAVFCAIDPQTNVVYLYDTLVMSKSTPGDHIFALKNKGCDWIPGASETALLMDSGETRLQHYQKNGLNLFPATEAKRNLLASIDIVWQNLVGGQLKIFDHLSDWLVEKNQYHMTEKNRITDLPHDLMDATRYAIVDGLQYADVNPDYTQATMDSYLTFSHEGSVNPVTGY